MRVGRGWTTSRSSSLRQTVALMNQRNAIDILRRRIGASVLVVTALEDGWSVAEMPEA